VETDEECVVFIANEIGAAVIDLIAHGMEVGFEGQWGENLR
jgi:hypothetical protein